MSYVAVQFFEFNKTIRFISFFIRIPNYMVAAMRVKTITFDQNGKSLLSIIVVHYNISSTIAYLLVRYAND